MSLVIVVLIVSYWDHSQLQHLFQVMIVISWRLFSDNIDCAGISSLIKTFVSFAGSKKVFVNIFWVSRKLSFEEGPSIWTYSYVGMLSR